MCCCCCSSAGAIVADGFAEATEFVGLRIEDTLVAFLSLICFLALRAARVSSRCFNFLECSSANEEAERVDAVGAAEATALSLRACSSARKISSFRSCSSLAKAAATAETRRRSCLSASSCSSLCLSSRAAAAVAAMRFFSS